MSGDSKARGSSSLVQLLVLLGLGAAVVIAGAFNRRLVAGQRLIESQHVLETQVARQESEKRLLQTQVAYATTDAAVVEWARTQDKRVQSGEILVVPVPGATPVPTPTPPPASTPKAFSNWELWLVLFFDRVPLAVNPISNP